MRKKKSETSGCIIETHKYYQSDFQRIMSKINKEICEFRIEYGTSPQFMIISWELATLFEVHLHLMEQRQYIMFNNKELEFYSVFGIPCIVSKALKGTKFEVR